MERWKRSVVDKVLVVGGAAWDLIGDPGKQVGIGLGNGLVCYPNGEKMSLKKLTISVGGNGANVAVGLVRLGVNTEFDVSIGSHVISKGILKELTEEGIVLNIHRYEGIPDTSMVLKTEVVEKDRIIFTYHPQHPNEFEYRRGHLPSWVFLTTIGQDWEKVYQQVIEFTDRNHLNLAVSPGSVQLDSLSETFYQTLAASKVLFANSSEAEKLLTGYGLNPPRDRLDQLYALHSLGPNIVSVTDGEKGSYALEGEAGYWISPFPAENILSAVGAGDAYTAAFLANLLRGSSIPQCMVWGAINASSVLEEDSTQAGLLTADLMEMVVGENTLFQARILERNQLYSYGRNQIIDS